MIFFYVGFSLVKEWKEIFTFVIDSKKNRILLQKLINFQVFFQKISDSIISILKVLFFSKFTVKVPKSSNSVCSILGNGPSLKTTLEKDIDFIKKTEIFCLNHFSITDFYSQLQPKNYLLLDPAFLDKNHLPCQKTIDILIEKTKWEINLFVPNSFLKNPIFSERIIRNSFIKLIPYNYTIVRGFDGLVHWFFRKNLGMPQCQNVMVPTLFYALNMGFREIYLFGADHSFHEEFTLDENNQIVGNHKHFYESKTYNTHAGLNQVGFSYMSRQFLSLHKAFYGYEVLSKYANSLQAKVKNASVRSYIDVFEKVKIEKN